VANVASGKRSSGANKSGADHHSGGVTRAVSNWIKWKEARKRLVERMAEWTTGEMHTEGWQLREDEGIKYMIGHAKIPQEEITTMIAKSGQKNAYLQRLARGNPPVQDTAWMRREKDETDSDYAARARRKASGKEGTPKPVAWRPGNNCWGIVGLKGEPSKTTYIIRGAPEWWGPEAVKVFLKQNGYSSMQGVSPPRHRGQGWLFQAVQKEATESESHRVCLLGGMAIMI